MYRDGLEIIKMNDAKLQNCSKDHSYNNRINLSTVFDCIVQNSKSKYPESSIANKNKQT